jgi:hypothetical protein
MYQTLEHTQSGVRAVAPSRRPSSLVRTGSRQSSNAVPSLTGLGLRRKWNTLRYVLLGTGAYAPPIGKFNV